jgi:hypothetical protein
VTRLRELSFEIAGELVDGLAVADLTRRRTSRRA